MSRFLVTWWRYSVSWGTNKPAWASWSWCYVEVISHSAVYVMQKATELTETAPKSWYRTNVNWVWNTWKEYAIV